MKDMESKDQLETEADKMRNHLSPIMTYTELILSGKMGEITEMQRKKIQVIRTEAEKMNQLLKRFKQEDVSKSPSIKNEIVELELRTALSEKELKDRITQFTLKRKNE